MPQTTFTIAVTADDGYVGGNAGTYPVTGSNHADSVGIEVACERTWFVELSSYYTRNGLLRWDTSSIPDTSVVVGAQLKMAARDIAYADNLDAMGEWYPWTPAIGSANFTPTPASTAFSVPISTLVDGDYNIIGLSGAEANVNKSGYTGIRLHTSQLASDAPPTGQNRHVWHSIDNILGFTAPQLIVSYVDGPIFRQKSEGSGTVASGSNISVTMPTGTVEDDRLLAAITLQGGTNATITPPAGWSLVNRINSTTALATAVYQKPAGASEAGPYSFGISLGGGGSAKYAYVCESTYTAEIGVASIDAASSQANAASTSVTAPTIDTVIGNSLLVFAGAIAVGGTSGATWTPPSGMTERADVASGTAAGSSAVKKFYLMGGTLTNSYQPTQEDGTAPADAAFATATGWIVATQGAGNYAELRPNTERAANQFSTTAVPTALGTGASANAFRTTNALSGTFAAGDWTLSAVLRSVTAAMATGQTGRLRWRVYKSANADGTSATELTSGVVLSNTVAGTGNTTANQGTRTATWSASQIVLSSEYLFFACAYEVVATSGTGNTRDANFRQNTNSAVTTPGFTLAADVAIELAEAIQTTQGPSGTKTATAQNAGVNTGTLIALASPIPGIVDKDATLLWDVRASVDAGVGLSPSIGLSPGINFTPGGAALDLLWDVQEAGDAPVDLSLQTLDAELLTPTVIPGAVTTVLALQTVTATLQSTTVVPGAVSQNLALQTLVGAAPTPAVVPGAVSTTLALQTLAASLRNTTVTPGAVSTALALQTISASLRNITAGGGTIVPLALQTLAGELKTAVVVPGAISSPLALQTLAASLRNTTVIPGGVSTALALQTLAAALRTATENTTGGAVVVPLGVLQGTGLLLTANVEISGAARPAVVVTLEVVPIASLSLETVPTAATVLETVPTANVTAESVAGASTELETVPTALVGVEQ